MSTAQGPGVEVGVTPRLDLVTIDCPDPHRLATFYAELLGWRIEAESPDFAVAEPPEGGISPERPFGRTALAFQRIDGYEPPTWPEGPRPQQFHLDFACTDLDDAEAIALAAGATKHDVQPSERGTYRVFLDPAGHPFCLCHG